MTLSSASSSAIELLAPGARPSISGGLSTFHFGNRCEQQIALCALTCQFAPGAYHDH